MKIVTACAECMTTHITKGRAGDIPRIVVEMNDTGIYRIRCPLGHVTYTFVQQEKYELLFDSGVMALRDGYPREAVSSIAAGVERFHEYCIRVFLAQSGVASGEVEKTWRQVSNASERQLGAFVFLYLSTYQRSPPVLPPKMVEFRNRVIHKGYISPSSEVVVYGEEMLRYMVPILQDLRSTHAGAIKSLYEARVAASKAPAEKTVAKFRASVVERAFNSAGKRPLSELIAEMPDTSHMQRGEALPMDDESGG